MIFRLIFSLLILLFTTCMSLIAEEIFDDVLKYEDIQEEIALEEENILHMLKQDKTKFIENTHDKMSQDVSEDEEKEKFEYSNERLNNVKQALEDYIEELEDNLYKK